MLTPLQSTIANFVIGVPLLVLILMWLYMYTHLDSGTITGQ